MHIYLQYKHETNKIDIIQYLAQVSHRYQGKKL